jgi:hypothetical protein
VLVYHRHYYYYYYYEAINMKNELFNSYLLNRQVHSEVNSVELRFLIILGCSGIGSLDSNELKEHWKNMLKESIFYYRPSRQFLIFISNLILI